MTGSIQISKRLDDGTILVIAGDTPDRFKENATGMVGESFAAELASQFFALIAGSENANPISPPINGVQPHVPVQAPAYQAPPAVQQAADRRPSTAPPSTEPPVCEHGLPRKYMTGVGKNAPHKPWSAWMCVKPKGESCAPQWA